MAPNIHTTSANAVMLVWGSLRLAPIIFVFFTTPHIGVLYIYEIIITIIIIIIIIIIILYTCCSLV